MLEKLPEAVGHALVHQRAGMENVLFNELHHVQDTKRLLVRSSAFAFNAQLPVRFTADGPGISPPLSWDDVPADATSIVIMVEDADAPTPHPLVHAIVTGLPARAGTLEEGALDSPDHDGRGFDTGPNSFLRHAWLPPDPPPGHGPHRYVFQVFALREEAVHGQVKPPGRGELTRRVLDSAVASGCIIGTYERRAEVTEPVQDAGASLGQPA